MSLLLLFGQASVGTKLYLPSTGSAAVSPAFRAGWDNTTDPAPIRRPISETPAGTAMTTKSYENIELADTDQLFYQGVSLPLDGDQTIAGEMHLTIRTQEGAASDNFFLAWAVYVVSNDGSTVRGVLQDVARDDTEISSASLASRYVSATASSVDALDGDRIVVEIGIGGDPFAIGGIESMRFGDAAASDLAFADGVTTDDRPLLRFAQSITFGAEGEVTVTPTTAALSLTTFAPTVSTPRVVTPTTAALTLTAFAPTVSTPRVVTPTTAALSLTTFAPTVQLPTVVTPPAASLTLTTFEPTVTATGNVAVVPETATLSLATFAPTVTASNHILVVPPAATLTLTVFVPSVTATANVVVTPSTASLSLAAFAPTVRVGHIVTPQPGSLILTTFVPIVATPRVVIPQTAQLTLTTFRPRVTATIHPITDPWLKMYDDSYFTGPDTDQDYWRKMYDDSYWRLIP